MLYCAMLRSVALCLGLYGRVPKSADRTFVIGVGHAIAFHTLLNNTLFRTLFHAQGVSPPKLERGHVYV